MELQFIGTGSIVSDRLSSSALVDEAILIDTPNGSMKAMRRYGLKPEAVDVCLITHFHADHFFDIVFLFLEQGLLRQRGTDLVLIGPLGFEERVQRLFELAYPGSWEHIRPRTRPSFVEIGDNGGEWEGLAGGRHYQVKARPVQHTVPTLGYRVTDDRGTTLGCTGDTAYCPAVEELASTSSTLIADTTFPTEAKAGHMSLREVEALAGRHPDLHILSTHISDDVPAPTRPNVAFPADGQRFTLDSHTLTAHDPRASDGADADAGKPLTKNLSHWRFS
ncbi:MBL fold metallo-hydrolase [Actinomadura oligospora]|uniref:MBL fold metallo-hydrolase n=1 Tax=Actinomadura oligospora TaxID=111804 RepID=UPI0004B76AA2|nr:ribonuclease Z [Actinomadura oligospora]